MVKTCMVIIPKDLERDWLKRECQVLNSAARWCSDAYRTVTVPLRPLADHHGTFTVPSQRFSVYSSCIDLPLSLRPNHAKPGGKQENKCKEC